MAGFQKRHHQPRIKLSKAIIWYQVKQKTCLSYRLMGLSRTKPTSIPSTVPPIPPSCRQKNPSILKLGGPLHWVLDLVVANGMATSVAKGRVAFSKPKLRSWSVEKPLAVFWHQTLWTSLKIQWTHRSLNWVWRHRPSWWRLTHDPSRFAQKWIELVQHDFLSVSNLISSSTISHNPSKLWGYWWHVAGKTPVSRLRTNFLPKKWICLTF